MRKVFIVARGREDIYGSLCRTLESEGDVLVIYDRRTYEEPRRERGGWRSLWSSPDVMFERGDRRRRTDVDDDIVARGFGVVHLGAPGRRDDYDDYDDDDDFDDEPLEPLHDD